MCSVCMSVPCLSRCPNASEPEAVHVCVKCGDGIFEGEQYIEGQDGAICRECLDEMTTEEWLEMLDETLLTAERKEERWKTTLYR